MRIEPIPYDELDPELRARFDAGLAEGRYTMTAPLQVYAYARDETIAMDESYRLTFRRGRLGPRLQELLRIRSAQLNGCAPCSSSIKEDTVAAADVACLLDGPETAALDERERRALEFLTLMSNSPDAIDDDTFCRLAAVFDTAEIVELGMACARYIGGHRWTHALDIFGVAEPLLRYDPAAQHATEYDPTEQSTAATAGS